MKTPLFVFEFGRYSFIEAWIEHDADLWPLASCGLDVWIMGDEL